MLIYQGTPTANLLRKLISSSPQEPASGYHEHWDISFSKTVLNFGLYLKALHREIKLSIANIILFPFVIRITTKEADVTYSLHLHPVEFVDSYGSVEIIELTNVDLSMFSTYRRSQKTMATSSRISSPPFITLTY